MKKTPVIPGKPIVMKTREDEEQLLMDWINEQSMYSDSIRYLIQKEIAENGLRNLQLSIPQFRTIESLKAQLANAQITGVSSQNTFDHSYRQAKIPPTLTDRVPASTGPAISQVLDDIATTSAVPANDEVVATVVGQISEEGTEIPNMNSELLPSELTNNVGEQDNSLAQENPNDISKVNSNSDVQGNQVIGSEAPQKRKGKKQFGTDVINSFAN